MNTRDPVAFGPYAVSIDAARPDHAVIRRADGLPPEPTWYELQAHEAPSVRFQRHRGGGVPRGIGARGHREHAPLVVRARLVRASAGPVHGTLVGDVGRQHVG